MDTNNNTNSNNNNRMQKPRFNFTWLYILLIAGLAFMIFTRHDTSASRTVDYTTFKEFVAKGYVSDVTVNKDNNTLTLGISPKYEKQVFGAVNKGRKATRIKVEFGSIDNLESYLDEQNEEGNFSGKVTYERDNDFISNLLWNFAPLIIIILIWLFIMRGMGGGGFMGGAGNIFSVAVLSVSGGEMYGNDGTVITLQAVMDESMDEGEYPLMIQNARYSLPNGQMIEIAGTTTVLTIENVLVGDVNDNRTIDIGDAVCIVNYIVGKPNAVFVERAADVNGNGTVGEIGDAVTVVNHIVGKAILQTAKQIKINMLDPQ